MPSLLTRRRALRSAGSGLVALVGGCLGGTPTATPTPTIGPASKPPTAPVPTGTYPDPPTGPATYPERPATLSQEAVSDYVQTLAHAWERNRVHEPDLEQASIHCRVAPNGSDHGGYYVIGICSGYVNYEDGTHADLGVLPVLYFVRPDLTVRVSDLDSRYFDCTDVFAAENSSQNFAGVCEGSTASYLVYNLRPERQTVDVAVGFLGSDGPDPGRSPEGVLDRSYDLDATAGVLQGSVTYRRGTYRLTATLESGREVQARWEVGVGAGRDWNRQMSVLVSPGGGLAVRRLSVQRSG